MPLPAHVSAVARRAQRLGNRHAPPVQVPGIAVVPPAAPPRHVSHARLVRVKPRQQARPRRAAPRRVVELGEAQPVRRQRIQVGRPHLPAVTSQVREPHVIRHDQENVRPLSLRRLRRRARQRLPPGQRQLCQPGGRRLLLLRQVRRLLRVGHNVVKLAPAPVGIDQQLPLALAHRHIRAAVSLPLGRRRSSRCGRIPRTAARAVRRLPQQRRAAGPRRQGGVLSAAARPPARKGSGNRSTALSTVCSSVRPAGVWPGQRATNGMRMPPS